MSPRPRGPLIVDTIAAISSRDIWISASTRHRVLVARRIGTTWRTVQLPRVRGLYEVSLAAAARNDIWAIGKIAYYNDPPGVIAHYRCQ